MKPRLLLLAPLLLAVSCSSIKQGIVIKKRARFAMDSPYYPSSLFRFSIPDIYWVEIEGRNKKGKLATREVIVFRTDWDKIKVGDHWPRPRVERNAPLLPK